MVHKLLAILNAHRKIAFATFGIALLLLLSVGLLSPRIYESHTAIHIQKKISTLDEYRASPGLWDSGISDHERLIKSDIVIKQVNKKLKALFSKHGAPDPSRLRISSGKDTRVIELHYRDSDPKFAKEFLSLLLVTYDDVLKQIDLEKQNQSLKLIKQRLAEIRDRRAEIETQVEAIRAAGETLDLNEKNTELVKMNLSYAQALGNINANLAASEREMSRLESTLGLGSEEIKRLSRVQNDPKIIAWQEELGKEQAELSELKAVYTDKYSGVIEKQRAIEQIQNLIAERVKDVYGASLATDHLSLSPIDTALGQKLLEENIRYIGLLGQRAYYEDILASMPEEFTELAAQERELAELKFHMSALKNEELKLMEELHKGNIEKAFNQNAKRFLVISPPAVPSSYVFPLQPKYLLTYGFVASILFSLFCVGLTEYLHPKVIDLQTLPVLAEVDASGRNIAEGDVMTLYRNLALMMNKSPLKTLTLFHLCESDVKKRFACPYSPERFAGMLAGCFSRRGVKTLLVECTQSTCNEPDESLERIVSDLAGYTLYRKGSEESSLHLLCPNSGGRFFDPYILKLLPDAGQYDLILLNVSLTQNKMVDQLLCEVSEATILGISQSQTSSSTLLNLQAMARARQVNLLGSVVFP